MKISVRRSFLNWGVFLVCLGSIPLAIELGTIPSSVASAVIRLWPVVLIGIGLGIMLRFTPFHLLGGVVVAAVAGLILGSLVGGGVRGVTGTCVPDQAPAAMTTRTGQFVGDTASVELDLTCVDLTLDRQATVEWRVEAEAGDRGPLISAQENRLSVRTAERGIFGSDGRTWRITVPETPALTLGLTMNASRGAITAGGALTRFGATLNGSDARIDLSGALGSPAFDATLNASSVTLELPDATLNGGVTLNASSLTVCAPPSAGVRITYSSTLASENFSSAGLIGSGENWQSPGFADAAHQIALHITSNVSSIDFDRSGGCQ